MRGVARVLRAGHPVGAGFLLTPRLLLTCAHVLNLALERDDIRADDAVSADTAVTVDLPNAGVSCTANCIHWRPPTAEDATPGPNDDIAVLLLDRAVELDPPPRLPDDGVAPRLGELLEAWGTPSDQPSGQWAAAEVSGEHGHLRQIRTRPETTPSIERGFSGGPLLLRRDADEIVGMLLKLDSAVGVAWIIPPAALRRALVAARTLEHRLSLVGDRLHGAPAGQPQGIALKTLQSSSDNDDALFDALFGGDETGLQRRRLDAGADAAWSALEAGEPRLRLRCADPEAALLPWHRLRTPDGARLADLGWHIEVTADEPRPAITRALDTPLILAPGDAELAPEVGGHVALVKEHLAPLLADPRLPPRWAVNGIGLDEQLAEEPDLIYCYACLDGRGRLVLGGGKSVEEALDPLELLRRIAARDTRPLLWLHCVEDFGELDLPALVRAFFSVDPPLPLLVVQRTREDDAGESLNWVTLNALGRLAPAPSKARGGGADAPAEPVAAVGAALAEHAATRGLCLLGQDGLRLHRPADPDRYLYASIRASLLRLLLGRTAQKDLLYARVSDPHAGSMVFYVVSGDSQARVHDFPDQARWHLHRRGDPELRVHQRVIPYLLHPGTTAKSLRGRFNEELRLNPQFETAADALPRLAHPPLPGETVVISLAWLVEPEPSVDDEQERDQLSVQQLGVWVDAWKSAALKVFPQQAIPDDYRILCGLCLQWPAAEPEPGTAPRDNAADWPQRQGSSDREIQSLALDKLQYGNPTYAECLDITEPLGRLRPYELERFFRDEEARLKHYIGDTDRDQLVQHVMQQTDGRFRATVELIYRGCRFGFGELTSA
jgi:hypothetical protein